MIIHQEMAFVNSKLKKIFRQIAQRCDDLFVQNVDFRILRFAQKFAEVVKNFCTNCTNAKLGRLA